MAGDFSRGKESIDNLSLTKDLNTWQYEYYCVTGRAGLWNTGLYTADFVAWMMKVYGAKIKDLKEKLSQRG